MQVQGGNDPEHRVVGVGRAELGRVVAARVLGDGQRREGDDRDAGVEAEHGDEDEVDRLRHLLAGIMGLLGHVGDGLDPGVGEHRDRNRKEQLRVARREAEMDLIDEHAGVEDEHRAEDDQRRLRQQVEDGEGDVEFGRLAEAADVDQGEQGDHADTGDHVSRVFP